MAHGGGGEDGDPNRWLVSYSDFITLLMVMFVVLYSMGQTDIKKYKQLADSMKAAFSGGGGGGTTKVISAGVGQGGTGGNGGESHPIIIPGIPKRQPDSLEVGSNLTQSLDQFGLENQVSVQTNIEGALVSLSEKLLFVPGTPDLAPSALPVMEKVNKMLLSMDNKVRIVGYTDDTPPLDSKRFASNWELSVYRATVLANNMKNAGIKPDRIQLSGRGEYDPIFPNDTPEHKALNSRAEIVIIYKVQSDVVDVGPSVSPSGQ